jgi:hypothetical protein
MVNIKNNIKIGRLVRSILKVSGVSFIEKDIETLLINIRRHLTFPKNMIKQFDIVKEMILNIGIKVIL